MVNKYFYLLILIISTHFSFSQDINKQKLDGVVAIVGDDVLFYSELNESMLQYNSQNNLNLSNKDLQTQVLEELLFQKLLVYHAKIDSIIVGDNEVNNNLERRLDYIISQIGSEKKVEKYFDKTMPQIKQQLELSIREQLTAQLMQQNITKFVDITPSEIVSFYEEIPKDSLPFLEDQYIMSQILILPNPSDSSILQTKNKLNNLRERISSGDKFSTMAILYSEDPGSSRNGGAYLDIKKGDFVREFESIAFSLDINELSEIFQTEYGYHIAQLIQRKGNKIDIRHILMTPKISNNDMLETKDFLDSLRLEIIDGEVNFELAAKKFSSDKETRYNGGLLINPNTNTSFFTQDDLDRVVYNEISTLSIGSITKPIYIKLPNGKEAYRIIKLVNKKDEHIANLDDDYNFLKNYCFQLKKDELLQGWYQKNIQKLHVQFSDESLDYDFYNNLLENE